MVTQAQNKPSERGILDGFRVVDLCQGLAGSMCALLLAEAGAEVVVVEPAGGDQRRGTAAFATWNRSKSSLVLDWRGADRTKLDHLLAGADLLVHDLVSAQARRLGLDAEALAGSMPALALCTIGGYPLGHRDENMPVDDFLVLASAGILDEQPAALREGPVYLPFPLGSWGAAWLAAIGVAASVLSRRRGGSPGAVATSLLQGGLAQTMAHWRLAERPTPALQGWPKKSPNSLFQCADGVWLHAMAAPDGVPLMQSELARLGPEEVARLNDAVGFQHPLFPNLGANRAAFRAHPSATWLEAMWACDIAVQPALRPGEAYFDEQARAMGYLAEVDDPVLGAMLQPAPPIAISPPLRIRGPAPGRGEREPPAWSRRQPGDGSGDGDKPLAGLRVLDFGQHLAGPFAPMLMADLGAEVIKIEALEGDALRPFEWAFVGCQRGKRALACNLKDARARAVILRLAAGADVVVHNLRMPAAERLGLGFEQLSAVNPRLIYTHCSAYGASGLRRDWPGYDQLFQALIGWESACCGHGNPPVWLRYGMMDFQCAFAATYGTLLALIEREASGRGQLVSTSILGAALLTTAGAVLVRPGGEVGELPRLDALQTGVGPGRRLYRCRDGWLALVAEPDEVAALGNDVEAYFAALTLAQGLAAANSVGACAVPARENAAADFLGDAHHRTLGLVAEFDHPVYGRLLQPGALLTVGATAMVADRPPSLLGEHSREVMAAAGLSAEEIDGLIAAGVVTQAAP